MSNQTEEKQFKIEPFTIRADTIEEFKHELSLWLSDQAIAHSRAGRIAKRKQTMNEEMTKADAYRFASQFVGNMKVEPKSYCSMCDVTTKPPNCEVENCPFNRTTKSKDENEGEKWAGCGCTNKCESPLRPRFGCRLVGTIGGE